METKVRGVSRYGGLCSTYRGERVTLEIITAFSMAFFLNVYFCILNVYLKIVTEITMSLQYFKLS